MKDYLYISKFLVFVLLIWFCTACEETADGPPSIADFSYEADENDPMTIHFNNTSQHYHASYWKFGDNTDHSSEDSPSHTYPAGGIYEVTLAVMGNGTGNEIVREINVIDPRLMGERIQDGNFEDESSWTVFSGGEDILTGHVFADGLLLSNEGENVDTNVVIWQAIEVEAGKEYVFSADVSSGGGLHQAWLEFHLSNSEPADGNDYSANNLWGINTWAGCGEDAFEGNIVDISCAGDGESDGIFVFDEGGTAYLVIKAGSWEGTLGEGITITNVSLIPADELE